MASKTYWKCEKIYASGIRQCPVAEHPSLEAAREIADSWLRAEYTEAPAKVRIVRCQNIEERTLEVETRIVAEEYGADG